MGSNGKSTGAPQETIPGNEESAPPRRRLFLAVAMPEGYVRDKLETLRDEALPLAWTPREKLHLTLRFFGETETERADALIDRVAAVRAKRFLLHFEGVGVFPGPRHPQAVWAGLGRGHPHLFSLQQQLEDIAVGLGFEISPARYSPHVTVGRCRRDCAEPVRQWLKRHRDFGSAPFEVDHFTLFRSRPMKGGAWYEPVRSFGLE
jgi:2'-5' RNA ligase